METRYRGTGFSGRSAVLPTYDYDADNVNRKYTKVNNEPFFYSSRSPFVVIVLLVSIFLWVRYVTNRLPPVLLETDIKNLPPQSFIGERAWRDLEHLTNYGPRVCGSHENDVRTVNLIVEALSQIKAKKLAVYNLEYEVKYPTGAFDIEIMNDIFTNSYQEIPIIVAKLEPVSTYLHSNDSVLLNCHFDSVPGSPGASDDMISCVTMLEILRVLSRQPKPLRNTIIFLFNGAEENFLPGSHGFIAGSADGSPSQGHRWKNEVRTVINLEACGAGGREIMFQTGPGNGWLVEAYAKSALYPFGTSIGEEIFQRGLIPSDTDFRVFRDFLKVPGLDFAFVKNGWVYHTKLDSTRAIPQGSLQNMGTNILALTKTLGDLDFSEVEMSEGKMVFTDVFNFFMVVYSERTGIIINVLVSLVTLYLIWQDLNGDIIQLGGNIAITSFVWLCALGIAAGIGFTLDLLKYGMPYFSCPTFVYLLYGIPVVLVQVYLYGELMKGFEDQSWLAAKATLAILTLFTTYFSRLAYVFTLNIGFGVLGWIVSRRIFRDSQRRMLLYLFIGELFPLAMSLYYSSSALDVFVPVMGRSGATSLPNIIIGLYVALTLSIPGLCGIIPIFVFFKKSFIRFSLISYALVIAYVVIGIGKIPYTEDTPMRLHIVDLDRNWFGSDHSTITRTEAGLWFFNLDPYTVHLYPTMKETVPEIGQMVNIDNLNCEDLYCGLPLFFSITKHLRLSQWIPKSVGLPAQLKSRVNMQIIQDEFLTQSRRRVTFSFSGPNHITIVFCPGPNYELVRWSLTDQIPRPKTFFQGRPTYFVKHGRGVQFSRFEIIIDFERKKGLRREEGGTQQGPLVDINLSSFSLHGAEMQTDDFKSFLNRIPKWVNTLGFSSVTNLYKVV